MLNRYVELSLSAQTAYAELAERTRAFELDSALAGLSGSFTSAERRGRRYWYFTYREPGAERPRLVYVGPDDDNVRLLVERFREKRVPKALAPQARAAIAQGCIAFAPKHYRVVKRLAEYGLFRAGVLLIGTQAFIALGNLLGVRWLDAEKSLDIDFAHAGRNVSVALPADIRIDAHSALESLEMGLLPIRELDGSLGAQYRSSKDAELRVDFVTSRTRTVKPVRAKELNVSLQPLKFMEFSLEDITQGCVFSNTGACTVNLPSPERFAVHKLIVHAERPVRERTKSRKDLLQAAALAKWFLDNDRGDDFNAAWRDALSRGRGWRQRALQGKKALLAEAPELDSPELWASI